LKNTTGVTFLPHPVYLPDSPCGNLVAAVIRCSNAEWLSASGDPLYPLTN